MPELPQLDYLIVDGYNILYAWPGFKLLMQEDLEAARTKLLEMMSSYGSYSGTKAIVVFDSKKAAIVAEQSTIYPGVEVVFSPVSESADSVITKLALELEKKGTVSVATSDFALQQSIFGRGKQIYRISALGLLEAIENSLKSLKENIRRQTTKPRRTTIQDHLAHKPQK